MKGALSEKHPELLYRKHTLPSRQGKNTCFLMNRQKLLKLDWEVLIHLP